ncbi:hypothetical protein E1218_25605 [Kribbella turkmenica]|uniref:Uncharacterized protein n=1 Tax=Kribbella turkmenica TaxID=2530375 RepID=A0A4R4WQ25_9ACTN|nr:hypothetical protein E1218_25605 [Kribbella turkmenica]
MAKEGSAPCRRSAPATSGSTAATSGSPAAGTSGCTVGTSGSTAATSGSRRVATSGSAVRAVLVTSRSPPVTSGDLTDIAEILNRHFTESVRRYSLNLRTLTGPSFPEGRSRPGGRVTTRRPPPGPRRLPRCP